ncbi:hypothetical protein LX36DRAFT_64685 [Colletotrichum falcatum]|nr:hypothetical protein LX36DRAFT_64685 [Colletotrichum falcatum]
MRVRLNLGYDEWHWLAYLVERLGGCDADKVPDLLPKLCHVLNGPLVETGIVCQLEVVLGVHLQKECPHWSRGGVRVPPELVARDSGDSHAGRKLDGLRGRGRWMGRDGVRARVKNRENKKRTAIDALDDARAINITASRVGNVFEIAVCDN